MAFENVTMPSIWDIPVAVGVPALLGQSIGADVDASASTALAGVVQSWTINQAAKKWGIYQNTRDPLTGQTGTENVLSAAHVHGVEYESSYAVSDAPLEDGGFTSYNKVKAPYNARILLVCDGSEAGESLILSQIKTLISQNGVTADLSVRQDFLNTLDRIVADTNLYHVVTPERTYINANIVGYRWRRTSENGVTMLMAEVALQEVRKTASSTFTKTAKPQGACVIQLGTVQTTDASQAVTDSVSKLPMFATGAAVT
ncbi:MAG: phage baseplate protein [Gluconobacter sp.]|uniref:phage baseplate protein n=1 Tax=Gluconobacter sp. TaxID=1876758 RepID=UPI0039E9BB81